MKQKLSASVIFLFFFYSLAMAQEWSKEDSVWLYNVLEGKEDLKINEETKKAIEDGRLIAPSWIKSNENNLSRELIRDLDDAGKPDSIRIFSLDPYSMPPAVYALYVLYLEKMDSAYHIQSIMISPEERKELEAQLPTGMIIHSFYARTSDYSPGFGITTDFNHLLSMVFSPQYRRIIHNRKHATAYKNYYDDGTLKSIRITELERKQLNRSVNGIRPSIRVSAGPRRGGIDD